MSSFRYSSPVLHELVKLPKRVVGGKFGFHEVHEGKSGGKGGTAEKQRNASKEARVTLEADGRHAVLLELVVKAGWLHDVTTYRASLLVDHERIRGTDYNVVGRARLLYKDHLPKGWHENVIDPNTGENWHGPIDLGTVVDLDDFCRKIAILWNISHDQEDKLL